MWSRLRSNRRPAIPLLLASVLFSGLASSGLGQGGPQDKDEGRSKRPAYAGVKDPLEKRTLLKAWKGKKSAGASVQAITAAGTPAVGRASMVINGAGTVLYTKNFVGVQASCDVDFRSSAEWVASTAHALGDFVHQVGIFGSNQFVALNAGTTGATEPVWPAGFGSTVVDGSITWKNSGTNRLADTAYTAGMVAQPDTVSVYNLGFLFLATTSGTTGGPEPVWPTTAGATVVDGGVTWQAIGYYPGSFKGCTPLQLVSRASGGAETVIAQEGDPVGGSQLSGWSEFYAMNSSGKAALRAELAGFIRNDDESSSAILTAGPGAGSLTKLVGNGDTIGGRFACGFSSMVGMNDGGQVVYDAYAPFHEPTWQANNAYTAGTVVYPTGSKLIAFRSSAGTSGAVEPVWPTTPGQTIADGGVTWTAFVAQCDENDHGIVRFTSGPGNQLLVAQGSSIGSPVATVIGFGSDNNTQPVGRCTTCKYESIEGFINSSGHVPAVLNLSDGTQGVFNLTGPGTATQVVRLAAGSIGPRASINNSDQIVYRANVGGVVRIQRFTPPSTTVTIASVGDTIGGQTITGLGAYTDINSSGHVVFQAHVTPGGDAFFYWDGTSSLVTTGAANSLASEMITLNDSNLVAYVTGTTTQPDETDGGAEGHESGGVFFWNKGVGSSVAIKVGSMIGGNAVTAVYAQHTVFARRQLSSAGCLATTYMVLNDDPEFDCTEGGQEFCSPTLKKGGQLFVSCATACPTITISPATLPGATQNLHYNQQLSALPAGTYTFAETGALPTGINLSPSGLLSGTPTVQGSFPITVTATNAASCQGTMGYTLVVGAPPPETIALSPSTPSIVVGTGGQLTVTINVPQPTDTVVTLTSANTGIVTVPPTVTILANQTSANFTATGVTLGGPVNVTAALPASFGAAPATSAVTIIAAPSVPVPTLTWWGLAILALLLAAGGVKLLRK